MTDSNPRGDLVARLTTVVDRLAEEWVTILLDMEDDALLALLQDTEVNSEQPAPAPTVDSSAHEEICIQFELNDEAFEAVGFLKAGEESVPGEEAIRRCDTDDTVVRSDEDWQFLHRKRSRLPEELRKYWLVTARPYPDCPRVVSSLRHDFNGWYGLWCGLDYQWDRRGLVVRRRKVSQSAE